MRVVIDTNVLISSFFGGNPRRVIDLWKNEQVTLCVSGKILDEYAAVVKRLGLEGYPEFQEMLALFSRGHSLVFTTKTPKIEAVPQDPDDDKFIECAVALKAEVVITGDKALGALKEYRGIPIVTPARFLKDFAEAG
ncbi:MAG: putative toxin-antitoxin system toxin component, PIN family [Nitrospinae bacterium]|nr:putative toxin-antitoxin system toxin component, PIN family [Nitrospinota bacterium]